MVRSRRVFGQPSAALHTLKEPGEVETSRWVRGNLTTSGTAAPVHCNADRKSLKSCPCWWLLVPQSLSIASEESGIPHAFRWEVIRARKTKKSLRSEVGNDKGQGLHGSTAPVGPARPATLQQHRAKSQWKLVILSLHPEAVLGTRQRSRAILRRKAQPLPAV